MKCKVLNGRQYFHDELVFRNWLIWLDDPLDYIYLRIYIFKRILISLSKVKVIQRNKQNSQQD